MKKIVWAKIPRAGLANKILVWANAFVFAKENNASLVVTNWVSVFIGPILRGENSIRLYVGYFKNNKFIKRLSVHLMRPFVSVSKNVKVLAFPPNTDLVVFDTYMDWLEFFDRIRSHKDVIKAEFLNQLLKKRYKNAYDEYSELSIGIHIRMGDFGVAINDSVEGFNLANSSSKRTPIKYFVDVIKSLRDSAGKAVKVSVFSDGNESDLRDVLNLENVELIKGNKDIEDLLMLSKSRVIVTSATSTFSLFAAYLSDAVILHHPNFYIRPVRNTEIDNSVYEGPFTDSVVLKEIIKDLKLN